MKVFPINNFYNSNNRQQNFNAHSTDVLKNDRFAYKTTTGFFRADIHWEKFIDYIINKYDNADKVNVINHACSAGYEPYSLLMLLMEKLGEKSKKYLPILARDIDNDMINFAKRCKFPVMDSELSMTKLHSKNIFVKNFEVTKIPNAGTGVWDNRSIVSCKTDLKNNIIFDQSDIFEDKEFINKENTILLFRNVWKYLGDDNISKLADFFAANMKKSSIIVIGDFDIANRIDKILIDRGFRDKVCEYNEQFVFEAPGK